MSSHPSRRSLFSLVTLTATLLATPVTMAAPPPGIPDGWADGFVYANGIRIHYYHATPATGKPVIVMVHGVTDNGLCWTTLTWKLQDQYDIYMLDTRGHGLSDSFTPSDNKDTLIQDVVEFVRVMKFEKPILMGHSMGGATVIRVGAEYPDLARAIVVLDAGISGRGGRGPGAPAGPGGPRSNAAPSSASAATTGATPSTAPTRQASSGNLSFAMNAAPEALAAQNNYKFEDLVAKGRRDNPKWDMVDIQYWALSKKQYHGAYSSETFREVMQGSMRTADSLAKITVPMIILKADASPEQRQAQLEAAKVMQKGKLVHIDGAGHNLHHDQLQRTVEVLTEFLATL
jgi:pimeloyl-ACP methyl ester carboxylesterase